MFRRMTKQEYKKADEKLAKGIVEFDQQCKFRDAMTVILGKK